MYKLIFKFIIDFCTFSYIRSLDCEIRIFSISEVIYTLYINMILFEICCLLKVTILIMQFYYLFS